VQADKQFAILQDGEEKEVPVIDVGKNKVKVFEGDNSHQDAVEEATVWFSDSVNDSENPWELEGKDGLSRLERYF
jgi:hypothetical protein